MMIINVKILYGINCESNERLFAVMCVSGVLACSCNVFYEFQAKSSQMVKIVVGGV